jgi:uncharacterized iron-regulated membrane protein
VRNLLLLWHRWFGLAAAVFLSICGLTGALIAWSDELDAWLNPQLYHVSNIGTPQSAFTLANRLETQDPRLTITWLPLQPEPGHSLAIRVASRSGTSATTGIDFDQVFVDPFSGKRLGERLWGEISVSRKHLIPFLYKLHYSLQLAPIGGIDPGVLLLGVLAITWSIDCFVALWLAFPSLGTWRKSLAFRWHAGGYKLTFDLHRSTGVWLWLLLLIVAVSSVSMNLPQVTRSMTAMFSSLTPSAFERPARPQPTGPVLSREHAVWIAQEEARRLGWRKPAGGIYHAPGSGLYGVGFFAPGMDHGGPGLGNPWIYLDDHDGQIVSIVEPAKGSGGDLFLQAQFPIHSGRILGLPGRILISVLGILVALLSVTGVLIWARKRRARLSKLRPNTPAQGSR